MPNVVLAEKELLPHLLAAAAGAGGPAPQSCSPIDRPAPSLGRSLAAWLRGRTTCTPSGRTKQLCQCVAISQGISEDGRRTLDAADTNSQLCEEALLSLRKHW